MSAAVMPMRSTVSAAAMHGKAAAAAKASTAAAIATRFFRDFSLNIVTIPLRLSVIIFDAIVCNAYAND
jgi:hypothetical protein